MSELDLQSILKFTVALAYEAGHVIRKGSEAIQLAGSNVDEKKNSVDLVTEYDVKVEELVKKKTSETYPSFKFIGEESYAAGSRPEWTDEPTFCVDPIDGTTNFVHGFPWVCISIGLIYKRHSILGVIYNPFLDLLYTGVKGSGSYVTHGGLNGTPRKLPFASSPKPLASLSQAQIAVEWGNDRASKPLTSRSESFHLIAGDPSNGVVGGRMAHSLRSLGSSAMNFAMVAQGGLDMYWEIGCWPWDVSAGVLIAQEAGGLVTGSHKVYAETKETAAFGDVGEAILTGRKYIVVRAIGDAEKETGREAQKRIIGEFYDTVQDYDAL
ncbi:inositol monophosphatase [Guyanagaster necrorhizus]|uniref:Inositol-1-monophosphatase n=1 Tax=Guyanagaster necrorhizus TaxID=856835 RepID=A0A9P8AYA6_9AGAR|nr:inositol monophosphatase [Guyanagaster necrorhizus MCA 3950]KAG7452031.1 inositol monophosphatase [Guyanagaster necrorhizus MCA 3950]